MTIRHVHKRVQIWVRHRSMSLLKSMVEKNRNLDSDIDINKSSILFLSQNRIGDTLITTPIYAALKHSYPDCIIDVLLSRRNVETLEDNPHIRLRYVIKRKPFDLFSVIWSIRKQKYDFVVDLIPSKSATSTAICLLSKSCYTVGLARDNDFAYDIKVVPLIGNTNNNKEVRMVENVAQLLRPFGIIPSLKNLKTEFYPNSKAMEFAQSVVNKLLPTSKEANKKIIIGVNISASKPSKYWGLENFVGLVKSIQNTYQEACILILYSSAYKEDAAEICKRGPAVLCDETKSLAEFAAVISKLELLITPDSASVHLADIYHVPLIILTSEPDDQHYWYPILSEFEPLHAPAQEPVSNIALSEVEASFSRLAQRTLVDSRQLVK